MANINPVSYYRWCIVPNCASTSIKYPEKTFIQVPKNEKRRRLWFNAIRRNYQDISATTSVFVCDDHFDLENDMKNYVRWNLMGGIKVMEETAIPHKFDCQEDRKRAFSCIPRQGSLKRMRKHLVEDALHAASTSGTADAVEASSDEISELPVSQPEQYSLELEHQNKKDVSVSVKPHYRSKQTQTVLITSNKTCSPFKIPTTAIATSPMKFKRKELNYVNKQLTFTSDESDEVKSTSSNYEATQVSPSCSTSGQSAPLDVIEPDYSKLSQDHTTRILKLHPRRYVGISKECFFIIELLLQKTSLDDISIYIVLQKIRLGQTFAELGDAYGISESTANRRFSSSIHIIAELMKQFIVWASEKKMLELLPIPFRPRYSKVQCIIDCLEIEIQKPTDAIKQALTWSEYKKANTLKYLISSTPDGIINYISTGYGGRTSDAFIVENSDFLNKLQPGAVVMADRGFKHIEKLLVKKKCSLLRSPSVSSGIKLDSTQVLGTKRIASLRIHIERVIRRVREFKLLKPHSCVHSKLVQYMDCALIIACGLVNLQGPIIK